LDIPALRSPTSKIRLLDDRLSLDNELKTFNGLTVANRVRSGDCLVSNVSCSADRLIQAIVHVQHTLNRIGITLARHFDRFIAAVEGFLAEEWEFRLTNLTEKSRLILLTSFDSTILVLIREKDNKRRINETTSSLDADYQTILIEFFKKHNELVVITFICFELENDERLEMKATLRITNEERFLTECGKFCSKLISSVCTKNECHLKQKTAFAKYPTSENKYNRSSSGVWTPYYNKIHTERNSSFGSRQAVEFPRAKTLANRFLIEAIAIEQAEGSIVNKTVRQISVTYPETAQMTNLPGVSMTNMLSTLQLIKLWHHGNRYRFGGALNLLHIQHLPENQNGRLPWLAEIFSGNEQETAYNTFNDREMRTELTTQFHQTPDNLSNVEKLLKTKTTILFEMWTNWEEMLRAAMQMRRLCIWVVGPKIRLLMGLAGMIRFSC